MEEFKSIFAETSTRKLLLIVQNAEEYSSEALSAAKRELETREDVEDSQIINEANQKEESRKSEVRTKNKQKFENVYQNLLATINPIEQGIPSTEKRFRMLVVVFSFLAILRIWDLIVFCSDGLHILISYFELTIPLIVFIVGAALFLFKKQLGWNLLYVSALAKVVNYAFGAYSFYGYEPEGFNYLESVIPQYPYVYLIMSLLFWLALCLTLLNKGVRNLFRIKKFELAFWSALGICLPFFIIV